MPRSYRSPTAATFRKGRKPERATATRALDPSSRDATHWTLTETETATDDDRPATTCVTRRATATALSR